MSNASTTVLSTIPSAPASPAPAAETNETPTETPAAETQTTTPAAPTAATEPPKPDPDLELAKKMDSVSRQAAKNRKAEAEIQSMRASVEKDRADIARLKAELEAALEDPVEYYLKKGKDPVEISKRIARPMSEEEKRIARLEEAEKRREEEAKKAREEAEQREMSAKTQQFWQRFVGEITPDEYPHLTSMHEAHEIPRLVTGLLNRPVDPTDPESPTVRQQFKARYDRDPTPKEIREALEAEAETRATSLMERLKPRSAQSQDTPLTPQAKSPNGAEESTSLSNQHAASSPSARAGNESREARLKRLKEELEAETASSE